MTRDDSSREQLWCTCALTGALKVGRPDEDEPVIQLVE